MTTSTATKKDIQKLQRAIVDGLEDVKAQDIAVYDTEHLSALFERVIIASGTSNRQTKALASSVRDAIKDAGFAKPRIEGEGNGEWIIVDCGQAVVHIMQPNFRQYYHLEELWGDKPVRLKLGAAKPETSPAAKARQKAASEAAAAPAKKTAKPEVSLKRSNAAKKGVAEAFPSKAQEKKAADAKKAATKKAAAKIPQKTPAKTAAKTPAKTAVKASAKAVAKKVVAKTVVAKKAVAKSPAGKKAPAKKAAPRKA